MNNSRVGNNWSLIIAKSLLSLTTFIAIFLTFSQFTQANNGSSLIIPVLNQEVVVHVNPGTTISGGENIYTNTEVIIYVSSSTIIYGAQDLSNAKMNRFSKSIVEKKDSIEHQKILGISREFVVIEKSQDKSIQQQHDLINRKVSVTFYSSTTNQEYYRWAEIILSKQISSPSASSYKAVSAACRNNNENIFRPQVVKCNYYTSFSFLEFSKIRKYALRGPPSV